MKKHSREYNDRKTVELALSALNEVDKSELPDFKNCKNIIPIKKV